MEDNRNVADKFKGWHNELIRDELKKGAFPFIAIMEHIQGDFNIGTLVRNGNAFGATGIYYIGQKRWDRRGAVGTHNYTDLTFLKDYSELEELKKHYVFVGLDNVSGAEPMENFVWPENVAMIFGEEGRGLSPEIQKFCDKMVYITQYGSVRSLNVGCASAIAFYDYVRKAKIA